MGICCSRKDRVCGGHSEKDGGQVTKEEAGLEGKEIV